MSRDCECQVTQLKPLIAIVDDDESVRETTRALMRSMGFSAEAFGSAAAFLSGADLVGTDCLVADINMPGMSGLDLHQHLATAGKPIPTILITAYPNERIMARALNAGVLCCLTKPFSEADLLDCVRAALGNDDAGR